MLAISEIFRPGKAPRRVGIADEGPVRKLRVPRAVLAPVLVERSGKNSGLISADEVEISSWLPYTALSAVCVLARIAELCVCNGSSNDATRYPRMAVVTVPRKHSREFPSSYSSKYQLRILLVNVTSTGSISLPEFVDRYITLPASRPPRAPACRSAHNSSIVPEDHPGHDRVPSIER
ncbi:hypothetical protein KM043_004007 [Ampulex compressa]|nr:hypothetical protein KM043_004007 [Ampulex compressa]